MLKSAPSSTKETALTFRVIQPKVKAVPRAALAAMAEEDEEEFQKGGHYLEQAIRLYQPDRKQKWYVGLAQSADELLAMRVDKADLILFSYSPPSQKAAVGRRIKRSLIQKGFARSAGTHAGSIVFVVMK
jgi:hypothetical protein